MNEVQSMAKAGEAVGAVLGTALMAARQGAATASKTSAATSRELAKRTQQRLADSSEQLQDALAENVRRARHELATAIEPPRRFRPRMPAVPRIGPSRRRLTWLVLAAALVAAAIAAVVSRRAREEVEGQRPAETERTEQPFGNGATPRELQSTQAAGSIPSSASSATRSTRAPRSPNATPPE